MDYVQIVDYIVNFITNFPNYPIPQHLHIYLEKWYPYIITFLIIFIIFYVINRYRFKYNLFENHSLLIFVIAFIFWAEFLVVPRLDITGPSNAPTKTGVITWIIVLSLLAVVLFLVSLRSNGCIKLPGDDYQDVNDIIRVIGKFAVFFSFFCFIFFCTLSVTSYDGSLTIGRVSCDIDSEYKIGPQINTLVNMGGPDTGLCITLLSEKPGDLKEISSLNLSSRDSKNQINNTLKSSECLTGKAIDAGKYNIFINTTSLDSGYYNLRLENIKYKQINSVYTFYLSE
ncbi:hypothetical protein [Methanosarcina mazei]|uniref:hypothetical protein n=1 Tax=Methanosarcina mazei TaxID=2209 RepID=UPI003C717B0F